MIPVSIKNVSLLLAGAAVLAGGPLAAAPTAPAAQAKPAPASVSAPVPVIDVPAIAGYTIRDVTRELSSDAYEGRGPGTPAEQKTTDYIIARFKTAGLEPGNNGSWLQDVPIVEIEARNSTGLAVSVGGQSLHFDFGKDMVAGSYRAVARTEIKDAPMVFVGYGINAPELGWNDYAGLDMKGKIAVILVNDPDYETPTEDGLFKGRRMTYYGRWTYKFEEAARQGAAGALIVHDTFPAAYGWQVVHSSWTGPQLHIQSANGGMDQTQANGWIQKNVAETIFKAAGLDLASLSGQAKQKGFKAVPLGANASLGFDNNVRQDVSHNVIGIQRGTKRANEYVLYTAHWDHLGRCAADASGDDICNGAIDNATGIGALVSLAETSVKVGPAERSQVFLAVTLEESGLLGSKYYAEHPVYPLGRTAGGVNMDGVGPGSPSKDVQATGGDKSELTRYLQSAMTTMGFYQSPEDHPERGHYYRSDHFSMAKLGLPMFAVGRGTDWVYGGKQAGEAAADDYVQHRYHQPSDQFDDSWDWSGAVQEIQLFYVLGRSLAMTADWPNWHRGDEFRAIRDQSRAALRARPAAKPKAKTKAKPKPKAR